MPKLFKKFDKDGNGDLEMEEFCAARQAGEDLSKMGIDNMIQHEQTSHEIL
jgi:Ca2+-binding EF-hand superfamily protein